MKKLAIALAFVLCLTMVFALSACGEPMTAEEFFAAMDSDTPNHTISNSEVYESPDRRLERTIEIKIDGEKVHYVVVEDVTGGDGDENYRMEMYFDGETLYQKENDGDWAVSAYEISGFLEYFSIYFYADVADGGYTVSGNVLTVNEDKLLSADNVRVIFGTLSADIEVTFDQFDENDDPIDPIVNVIHITKIGSTTISEPSGLPQA